MSHDLGAVIIFRTSIRVRVRIMVRSLFKVRIYNTKSLRIETTPKTLHV